MVGLSFYNSNSINTLFSSMNHRGGAGNLFSNVNLADYSSIKSGSYGKLLRSYYSQNGTNKAANSVAAKTVKKVQTEKTDVAKAKVNSAEVKTDAADLVTSAKALKDSALWEKKNVTSADGTQNVAYDKDKIYKALTDFTADYNELVKDAGDSNDNSILNKTASMVQFTEANKRSLSDVGVTINKDNTLSVDKSKFDKANMTAAKNLFSGNGSYTQSVSTNATRVYASAVSSLANLESGTTYSNTGAYRYSTSAMFNQYL